MTWEDRRAAALEKVQDATREVHQRGRTKQRLEQEIERLTEQRTELLNSRFNATPTMQAKNARAAADADAMIASRRQQLSELDAQMRDALERQEGGVGELNRLEDETRG